MFVLGIAVLLGFSFWFALYRILAKRSGSTVAFIAQTTGTEMWEAAHTGAHSAGLLYGFRIYWNAPTRSDDVERQIELIQSAISNKDAGLIIAPVQYLALVSSIHEAMARHIPVVLVGSSVPIPAGKGLTYVLNDDVATGRIAARKIGSILHKSGTIALLGLNPNLTGNWIRGKAFESTLGSEFPDLSIVEREISSPTVEEAALSAERILLRNPHLDAIVALTSTDTEGALIALRLLQRTGTVRLVGCDQEIDLMEGIRQGQVDAIVAENSYAMGQRAVQDIAALQRGQSVPSAVIQPLLITQSNIDLSEVQKILSVNWRGKL